jgi:hypothetical protein
MKKHILPSLFVVGFTMWVAPAYAQIDVTPPHTSSTISSSDRYEIIQSHLAARWTFRLDRFCGSVSILVSTKDDGTTWESMDIDSKPACKADGRTHYQLFSSSLAAKHTFLMNTDTGATWLLVSRKSTDGAAYDAWDLFE